MDTAKNSTRPLTVSIVTLGCAKNAVDSEKAMGVLAAEGFGVTSDPAGADVVVVNTCGFIEQAREESIDEILALAELKKKGDVGSLVVAGCLSVRYSDELQTELPEVDHFLGLVDGDELHELCRMLENEMGRDPVRDSTRFPARFIPGAGRVLTTPGHYAYLKIAEGCSNACTFCAIPSMRGKTRSIDPDGLVAEARGLAGGGVRELLLVAQDTSHYGLDLGRRGKEERMDLARLIGRLDAEVEGVEWIRLMYTYPSRITDELLLAIARSTKVLPYIDIPVQSGSNAILKAMGRGMGRQALMELMGRIRERVPGVTLRTSVIVGFPGESERDFLDTVEMIESVRFERLGVFTFSPEEGTPAFELGGRVPPDEMERRAEELLGVQKRIVAEQNEALWGEIMDVMIDEELQGLPPFSYLGRTRRDAPEVDQAVYVEVPTSVLDSSSGDAVGFSAWPGPGDVVRVEIVGSTDYDLEGMLKSEMPR